MIGKDKKKMAEEATLNLQRLSVAGIEDLDNAIDTLEHVEQSDDYVPPPTGASRRRASHSSNISESDDSGRRKSVLNSGLALGLDLDVPSNDTGFRMGEDTEVDEHGDFDDDQKYDGLDQQAGYDDEHDENQDYDDEYD